MKNEGNGVTQVWGLWVLTGLVLFAGPVLNFVPDLIRHDHFVPDVLWHDRQRIEQVMLLLVVALAAATIWRKPLLVTLACLPKSVRWTVGLGFALGGLSAVLSVYPRFAGLEWATFLLLFGLAFLLAGPARLDGPRYDVWAMRLVVALSAVIVLRITVWYLAMMMEGVQLDSAALFESSFSNRRAFGQVASMLIPLLAYPLLTGNGTRIQRWSVFALLSLWWMLAIASGTRGTWVALAAAAVVLAAFAWRACVGWLKTQVGALGVGALSFAVLFVWLPAWLAQDVALENRVRDIASLSGRGELWAMTWAQIQAHPWLGIGPMHLAAMPTTIAAHPHNSILQLVAEWGVFAALAFLLPAAIGMLRLRARLREQASSNVLLVCLAASLLAAGTQSMVDGVIVIPYTQTWLALIVGWALGVYFRDPSSAPRVVANSRVNRLGIPVLSLFALVLLLNGVLPEMLYRVEATWAFIDAGNRSFLPRYWSVGVIP